MVTPAEVSPLLGVIAFIFTCTIAIPIALAARFIIELLVMLVCLHMNWYNAVPFGKKFNLCLFILLFFPALYLIFAFVPILTGWVNSLTERVL
jgi:hypothetical protein